MTEPTTEAGRALGRLRPGEWMESPEVLRAILAIEAEAAAKERERLRRLIQRRALTLGWSPGMWAAINDILLANPKEAT